MYLTFHEFSQKTKDLEKKGNQWRKCTGKKLSNWVAVTILPSLKASLPMMLLQVLQDDRADLAYSAFHGFGGFAILFSLRSLQNQQRKKGVEFVVVRLGSLKYL